MRRSAIALTGLVAVALQLVACVVYPTSRTYYEPTDTDGKLRNQTGCGYMRTHDTVERHIEKVLLAVMVGSEKEPLARNPTLQVTIVLDGKSSTWHLNEDNVVLILESPLPTLRPSSVTRTHSSDPKSYWLRSTLTYPKPAGLADKLELRFEPGALSISGTLVDVTPYRFVRKKRSDMYFASINC